MKNLTDFIRVYDDILSKDECEAMVAKYEGMQNKWETHNTELYGFSQINLTKTQGWEEEAQYFANLAYAGANLYFKDVGVPLVPTISGFEEIRLKRYEPDSTDRFDLHVDAYDHKSAKRYLVCFAYLKDNEEGATEFPTLDYKVECKQGRVLFFPPLWLYPHAGLRPIKVPKYILGTYLHFT